MPDVVIVHAREKAIAAQRLRDAVAGGGYAAEAVDAASPALASQVGAADVVLLVWSKATMASDAAAAAAADARRSGKLVEVSPDGLMPVSAMEDGRAILVSGWRGEPFHPGWQKVAAEIERICGRRKSAAAPTARSAGAAAVAPAAQPVAETRPAAQRPRPVRLGAVIGVAAALLAAMGTAAWMTRSGTPERPPAATAAVPAGAAPEAEPAPPSTTMDAAELPPVEAPSDPAPAPSQASATEPERRPVASAASRPRAAFPPTPAVRAESQRRPVEAGRPIRYRHSRTMRLFCERAGRGTPQCRTFLRATRSD